MTKTDESEIVIEVVKTLKNKRKITLDAVPSYPKHSVLIANFLPVFQLLPADKVWVFIC